MSNIEFINRIIYKQYFTCSVFDGMSISKEDSNYLDLLMKAHFDETEYNKIVKIYNDVEPNSDDEEFKEENFIIGMMIKNLYDYEYDCDYFDEHNIFDILYYLTDEEKRYTKRLIKLYIDIYERIPKKYESKEDKAKYVYIYIIHKLTSYIVENIWDIHLVEDLHDSNINLENFETFLKSDEFINNEDFKDNKLISKTLSNNLNILNDNYVELESRNYITQ